MADFDVHTIRLRPGGSRVRLASLLLLLTCCLLARDEAKSQDAAGAQGGTIVEDTIHSPALARNLLGDSPDRPALVYLPPSYARARARRYPVLYLLHGYQGDHRVWLAGAPSRDLPGILDDLTRRGVIGEMIVVMPNANNRFRGSFYTDSATTGGWQRFITEDLVRHIDRTYRTLARPASRGLAGHSMGGYGAIRIAMRRPDVFGAVYALSACCLGWGGELSPEAPSWRTTLAFRALADLDRTTDFLPVSNVALAAAWSPDPARPPFYAALPFAERCGVIRPVEPAYSRWTANMPLETLDEHRAELRHLRAIAFDVGTREQFAHIRSGNRRLSALLEGARIPHAFELYDGDHSDRIPERLRERVLPFFSRNLSFTGEPAPRRTLKAGARPRPRRRVARPYAARAAARA